VTLIKPTAIHTPFLENAKNYLAYEPHLPSPVYAPELVAEAILHCAETPTRDFFVGETAKAHSSMALNAPRLYEKMNETMIDSMQNSGFTALADRPDGLYQTNSNLRERGSEDRFVLEDSLYQRAKIHPLLFGALVVGGLAGATVLVSRLKSKDNSMNNEHSTPDNSSRIEVHMEVFGSDNQYVGRVDNVENQMIKLAKNDAFAAGKHHLIPVGWVAGIEGNRVRLSKSSQDAQKHWETKDEKTKQNTISSTATSGGLSEGVGGV
jgi:hypothetical protein